MKRQTAAIQERKSYRQSAREQQVRSCSIADRQFTENTVDVVIVQLATKTLESFTALKRGNSESTGSNCFI